MDRRYLDFTERQKKVIAWLRKNPGFHGPTEIGLGVKFHPVKNISAARVSGSMPWLVKMGVVEHDFQAGHYRFIS